MDRQTPVKRLACLKLRLRAVKIRNLQNVYIHCQMSGQYDRYSVGAIVKSKDAMKRDGGALQ